MKSIDPVFFIYCAMVKKTYLVVLAFVATIAMLASPASAMPASLVRVIGIAESISSQLIGLALVCALVGLSVIADRRRRSRARSSAA